jgi:uncharacterized protein (TIGR04141 family)
MLQHLLDAPLLHLRIDLLRHDDILLDSHGGGIKPGRFTAQLALSKWERKPDDATKYVEEGDYNKQLAAARGYALLDTKNLHFGAYQKIEICDLLAGEKQLVCVKRASRSSSLSHLFAQGSVSTRLMNEPEYQDKLLTALQSVSAGSSWGHLDDWTVVYAMGTTRSGSLADCLFFFSQVNLMTHVAEIRSRSVHVAIAKIEM